MGGDRFISAWKSFRAIHTGTICYSFSNIFTVTTDQASEPVIRRDGLDWWQSFYSRVAPLARLLPHPQTLRHPKPRFDAASTDELCLLRGRFHVYLTLQDLSLDLPDGYGHPSRDREFTCAEADDGGG